MSRSIAVGAGAASLGSAQPLPTMDPVARERLRVLDPGADQHDVFDRRARRKFVAQQCQPLGRGDEHAHVAVPQDVADLCGPQQRIHRHEGGTGGRRPEDRRDRLDPLVEEHRDPLFARHTEVGANRRQHLEPASTARRS